MADRIDATAKAEAELTTISQAVREWHLKQNPRCHSARAVYQCLQDEMNDLGRNFNATTACGVLDNLVLSAMAVKERVLRAVGGMSPPFDRY